MKVLSVIRSNEWWEYKLPPLLAIGYATVISSNKNIVEVIPWLFFLLLSIIVGAIYVSLINDFTDMKEDLASGKYNRMASLSPLIRWVLIFASLMMGSVFAFFLANDILSLALYLLPWIAFTLYSVPPIRLKKRGIWGVFADACGAHLFPSLLMLASTANFIHSKVNSTWFIAVAIWAFTYGLRGILWHQFLDRKNDMSIGLRTYATTKKPHLFKLQAIFILLIELIAVASMLSYLSKPLPLISLLVYLFLIWACNKKLGKNIVIIIPPFNKPHHIIMSSFYQVFLPLSLLLTASLEYPFVLILVFIHVLIFPGNIKIIISEVISILRIITLKKQPL